MCWFFLSLLLYPEQRQSTTTYRKYFNMLKDLISGSFVQFHSPSLNSSSLTSLCIAVFWWVASEHVLKNQEKFWFFWTDPASRGETFTTTLTKKTGRNKTSLLLFFRLLKLQDALWHYLGWYFGDRCLILFLSFFKTDLVGELKLPPAVWDLGSETILR